MKKYLKMLVPVLSVAMVAMAPMISFASELSQQLTSGKWLYCPDEE